MTPSQIKLALKLYKAYKTESSAYHKLAEDIGVPITELNRRCWYLSKGRQYPTKDFRT